MADGTPASSCTSHLGGHSQEHPDGNSTQAYLTGSSTATTTEEEEEEWRGFVLKEGSK
eukprot:superscaffoldBa00000200_g2662